MSSLNLSEFKFEIFLHIRNSKKKNKAMYVGKKRKDVIFGRIKKCFRKSIDCNKAIFAVKCAIFLKRNSTIVCQCVCVFLFFNLSCYF